MINLNEYGEHKPRHDAPGDPASGFLADMTSNGVQCSEAIVADGKIHRFSVNGKRDKDGWYILHVNDLVSTGFYGDWSSETQSHKWCSREEHTLSPSELARYREHERIASEQRAKEEKARIERGIARAQKAWSEATPAINHPYLIKKGVPSHDLRVSHDGRLVVPMKNHMDEICGVEYISQNGEKKTSFESPKGGCYFTIKGNQESIYICEGYATGATIHQVTGGTSIVAFSANNIPKVAEVIKAKFPASKITICADNDKYKPDKGNAGITYAQDAARKFNLKVLIPSFRDESTKPTDFNDLAALEGIDAVKDQILEAPASRVTLSDWSCDLQFQRKAKDREWLIEDTIPLGTCSILAAMGDSGKGFMMLDLCLSVAEPEKKVVFGKPMAFGHEVLAHGVAVYITAEDDHEEIIRRLEGIDPSGERRRAAGKNLIIVPLPNAGGPLPMIVQGRGGNIEASVYYHEIRKQLISIRNLKLVVFDPMASFIMADINNDPSSGSFTTGLMSSLAHETGATVNFCHHMKKADTSKGMSPEKAREMVRGTSALVDGVRSVYALWPADYMYAQRVCRRMGVQFTRNKVFCGSVIKSNGPSDRDVKTYVRNDSGLLVACDDTIKQIAISQAELDALMVDSISYAAKIGHPFTKSGANGIIKEQKHRIYKELQDLGEKKLKAMVDRLLEEKEIVMAAAEGEKTAKWLDVPAGSFALGIGKFETGLGDTVE